MRRAATLWLGATLAACSPTFDEDPTRVSVPTLLAVRADPPEVAPGEPFTMRAIIADASGLVPSASLDWALCELRTPVGESGPVNRACFAESGDGIEPLGVAPSIDATMPADACRRFGPDAPPPDPGQPAQRPVDPDVTGGWYQPLRLHGGGDAWALASERITCTPSGLSRQVLAAYVAGAKRNVNPLLEALVSVAADGSQTRLARDGDGGVATHVARGSTVRLRASWPSCPTTATCGDGACSAGEDVASCASDCATTTACGGAELYLAIDPETFALTTRREAMSVTWLATDGTFDDPRSGRAADDDARAVDDAWTAPSDAATVHLFVVLRDDRGGTDVGAYTIVVD